MPLETKHFEPPSEAPDTSGGGCQLCGLEGEDDTILLCDGCDSEFHMACLNPPLATVPRGDFYCYNCVNKTASPTQQAKRAEYLIVKETRTANKPTKYKDPVCVHLEK